MLRWILLIPFACLVAMGAGLFFLAMASVASPAVAMLIGGGIERLPAVGEAGIDFRAQLGLGRRRFTAPRKVFDLARDTSVSARIHRHRCRRAIALARLVHEHGDAPCNVPDTRIEGGLVLYVLD